MPTLICDIIFHSSMRINLEFYIFDGGSETRIVLPRVLSICVAFRIVAECQSLLKSFGISYLFLLTYVPLGDNIQGCQA